MQIDVVERTLTDASRVYDVLIGEQVFPAVTKEDAFEFATKIADAIGYHTLTERPRVFVYLAE